MNRILEPTTIEGNKEHVKDNQLLNRQFLFTKDGENFYIKYENKLIPIGGNIKQDLIKAGDNIEILRVEDPESLDPDIIRLLDDIDINTCTLSPDGKNTYNWKGTYLLGTTENNNCLFILTKQTVVGADIKSIIGGEILFKILDKKGRVWYAHYAMTCTSTGSWSLAGASCAPLPVRMCICKHQSSNEYYYGLKIPNGDFKNVQVMEIPSTEEHSVKVRTYLQINDKDAQPVFSIGKAGDSVLPLTPGNLTLNSEGILEGDYSLSLKDLIDNLGWRNLVDNSSVQDNPWKEWDKENTQVTFHILTKDHVEITYGYEDFSDTLYIGVYNYPRPNTAECWIGTQNSNYAFRYQGYVQDPKDGSTNSDIYTCWYSIPANGFILQACNIQNPEGDWSIYANDGNRYVFYFLIYINTSQSNSFRIQKIQVRDKTKTTNVINHQNPVYNYNLTNTVNMGEVIQEYTVNNPGPFKLVNPDSSNMFSADISAQGKVAFGNFSSTVVPIEEVVGLEFKITGTTFSNPECAEFFDDNFLVKYPDTSFQSSVKNPIFGSWGSSNPVLFYKDKADNFTKTYCFFADFIQDYSLVVDTKVEEVTVEDKLEIERAELWFNGWNEIPESLKIQDYSDSDFTYQVLSNKSEDNDSFAETFYGDMDSLISKIPNLQITGEDNAPYKLIITGEIHMSQLLLIADLLREPEKQFWLDMSGAWVAEDAKDWNEYIFKNCISLRGFQLPRGVKKISTCVFLWCTYLRILDLSASNETLQEIGSLSGWSQAIGILTSTRVRTLRVPSTVYEIGKYLIGSSNIRNLVFLHEGNDPVSEVDQWSFCSIKAGGQELDFTLPENFHWFVSESWYNGYLKNTYRDNNAPYHWKWNTPQGWFFTEFVNSIVLINPDWDKDQWQDFADRYYWTEEMVNKTRIGFGRPGNIEIVDPLN